MLNSKERLKVIKSVSEFQIDNDSYYGRPANVTLKGDDVKWLIEQVEKREYWMKQHRKRVNELEDAYFKIQWVEKQLQQAQAKAERYREAIEVAIHNMADSDNLGVKFALGVLERALEGEE